MVEQVGSYNFGHRSATASRMASAFAKLMNSFPDTDPSKCLDELEGKRWEQDDFGSSLVVKCHKLRRLPIQELGIEDLRILIGQDIGLPFLIPLALEELRKEPLASGDLYSGDLLSSVCGISYSFWLAHPDGYSALQAAADKALKELKKEEYISQGDMQLIREIENATSTKMECEQGASHNADKSAS